MAGVALAAEGRSHELRTRDLRMHCVEYPGGAPTLLLLHSLTGNARIFDGLIAAGLAPAFRVLAPDMRGRGETEIRLAGYSLDDGCADLIALLDELGVGRVAVAGHSFGGLLGIYFAVRHPERVSHLVLLDAAAEMHPAAPLMTAAATTRLDQVYPSLAAYRSAVQMSPFVNRWHEEMNAFVEADAQPLGGGAVTSRSRGFVAAAAALHIHGLSRRDWRGLAAAVGQPALLIQATEPFLLGMPMVPDDQAEQTARLMNARQARATGNHFTMLFGAGADEITASITAFLRGRPAPLT
ncbi:MAG TPA: alpha/beta hydrolase [Caldimonas sp.]|jgi:pimeloyl-ACP methyl ester carboxylesterase|nr:alpha/beta hydrolase [Caldimonas sp.]HEX2542124.1 alpha/beta hydrolase [Caldimonas sp.]